MMYIMVSDIGILASLAVMGAVFGIIAVVFALVWCAQNL
jgi:hypothetical protein